MGEFMVLATLFASGIYSRFTSLNIFALFFFFFLCFPVLFTNYIREWWRFWRLRGFMFLIQWIKDRALCYLECLAGWHVFLFLSWVISWIALFEFFLSFFFFTISPYDDYTSLRFFFFLWVWWVCINFLLSFMFIFVMSFLMFMFYLFIYLFIYIFCFIFFSFFLFFSLFLRLLRLYEKKPHVLGDSFFCCWFKKRAGPGVW